MHTIHGKHSSIRPRPITPPKIWIPTEFADFAPQASDETVSFCGCENSHVSAQAMEAVREVANAPSIYMSHWRSQDMTLRCSLAKLHGVDPEQVFLTSGAISAVRYAFEVFARKGVRVGLLRPDFPGFIHFADKQRASTVWLDKLSFPFTYSVSEVQEFLNTEKVEFFIFSNPSAVTGTICEVSQVESLVAETNALVVVDEADSITTDSASYLTSKYQNVLVLRSFSKFYGLAGLRIGYLICPREFSLHFDNVVNPAELTSMALVAAKAVLSDVEYQSVTQATVKSNREKLEASVAGGPFKLVPGSRCFASFLWADESIPDPQETLLAHRMKILEGCHFGLPRGGRINLSNAASIGQLTSVIRNLHT